MPFFSSATASPKLLEEIFTWGEKCKGDCKNKLIELIKAWPTGAKPAQLVHATYGKLGTYLANLSAKNPIARSNYDLLVHVHNHDNIGYGIDPDKKWGKTLNMGGCSWRRCCSKIYTRSG